MPPKKEAMMPKEEPEFSKYMQSETVKVTVGKEETNFTLPMALLKEKSPFLARQIDIQVTAQRANSPLFVADYDNISVHLPGVELAPFRDFVNFLYDRKLTTAVSEHTRLVSTYLLAHNFECVAMRNKLLDTLCQYHIDNPSSEVNLSSMIKLAEALKPDEPANASKNHVLKPHEASKSSRNKLLKFMVETLTYKIFTASASWKTYRTKPDLLTLLSSYPTVLYWHLDALHEMQKSACPTAAFVDIKPDPDAPDGDAAKYSGPSPHKRVKRGSGGYVPNPAVRGTESCLYHEHYDVGDGVGPSCPVLIKLE